MKGAPLGYRKLFSPLPGEVRFLSAPGKELDLIHCFTKSRRRLELALPSIMKWIRRDGMIWVSWPKLSSKVETNVTEDIIRKLGLPLGLMDVKVCAVDDIWSGLKLVIRKENR